VNPCPSPATINKHFAADKLFLSSSFTRSGSSQNSSLLKLHLGKKYTHASKNTGQGREGG
jgi:hypothetical protein